MRLGTRRRRGATHDSRTYWPSSYRPAALCAIGFVARSGGDSIRLRAYVPARLSGRLFTQTSDLLKPFYARVSRMSGSACSPRWYWWSPIRSPTRWCMPGCRIESAILVMTVTPLFSREVCELFVSWCSATDS